jgi:hypothetical protein
MLKPPKYSEALLSQQPFKIATNQSSRGLEKKFFLCQKIAPFFTFLQKEEEKKTFQSWYKKICNKLISSIT